MRIARLWLVVTIEYPSSRNNESGLARKRYCLTRPVGARLPAGEFATSPRGYLLHVDVYRYQHLARSLWY